MIITLSRFPLSTVPTAAPTDPGPSVEVDAYTLTYTLQTNATADEPMLNELLLTTQSYIDEFLRGNFLDDLVLFQRAETTLENYDPPNAVGYDTELFFFPASATISTAELNQAIRFAFMGSPLQTYIGLVQSLPSSNIFRQTTDVGFQLTAQVRTEPETESDEGESDTGDGNEAASTPREPVPDLPTYDTPPSDSDNGAEDSNGGPGIVAAAGAGAFLLVVAGYVVYRRSTDDLEPAGKFIDPDGHMTVTGDTYVGGQSMEDSTYVGNQSMDSHSAAPQQSSPYRSETPEWKEYHSEPNGMMSESEWEEYQEKLENEDEGDSDDGSRSRSPFEAIPEEKEVNLPYGEDDESFPDRVLSELDDVTL